MNTRPVRIAFVTPFFPPEIGGAQIYCYELAREFAARGHEVHVFTRDGGLQDEAYSLHPILTFNLDRDLRTLAGYDMDLWHALAFFYAPLALSKRNVFITGHGEDCFTWRIRFCLPGRQWLGRHLLWRLGAIPRTHMERGMRASEMAFNYFLYSVALLRARQVIAVSHYTRSRLAAMYPLSRRKISVIPPGVSERFFGAERCPSGRLLLTVSRLDETDRIKNIHGVLHALGDLKDDYEFRYVIIGGALYGNYRRELEQIIADRSLQDRVTIEGRKSDSELLDYYRSADLFILVSYAEPTNFEGFGIVFLEANACGVPVLTSREGGMTDYVVEGVNGFYAPDTTATGIKAAVKRYLDGEITFDPAKVRRAPEPYRWGSIAERVLEVYSAHAL